MARRLMENATHYTLLFLTLPKCLFASSAFFETLHPVTQCAGGRTSKRQTFVETCQTFVLSDVGQWVERFEDLSDALTSIRSYLSLVWDRLLQADLRTGYRLPHSGKYN